MGLLDPNSAAYQQAMQGIVDPNQGVTAQQPSQTSTAYRREGDYGTRNKYDTSAYRRDPRQGVASFQTQTPMQTTQAPPEQQLRGIFGEWGQGSDWGGLLNMPKNNFSYESQGFNYTPQEFNYTPQQFNYEPQPFNYEPNPPSYVDYSVNPYSFGVK